MTTNQPLVGAKRFFATALFLSATSLLPAQPPPAAAHPQGAQIPIESFFADAKVRSVQLSPDGQRLAYLTPVEGRVSVALMDLNTGSTELLVRAADENISSFFWKGNDRILYGGDLGGNESLSLRSMSLTKRNVVALSESYKELVSDRASYITRILDTLRFDPNHIVVLGNKGVGSFNWGIFLVDVRYGDRTKMQGADVVGGAGLLTDNTGVVRALNRVVGKTMYHEVRASRKDDFFKVGETASDVAVAAPTFEPILFNADNETLYVITRGVHQPSRLRAYHVPSRAYLPEPDYELPGEYDTLVMSWDRKKLLGVYYTTDRLHVHWFDQGRAGLQAKIDAALPNTVNRITNSSEDEQTFIIVSTSDRQPGTYYILSLQNAARGRPAIMELGRINTELTPDQLQPMQPISYKARDGLTIHGYLTLPYGYKEGKRVPLIINPHGGPYGIRDDWGYNSEVQFLASRGYAVLQPNYRGSGGYGTDFLLAGRREWGGKMQDDLSDGVQWAIDQGIADPDRVAIVGASYGGYAALAGVTFTPELYRCAVNYVGVSDLSIIAGWSRTQGPERIFQSEWIGDDADYLYKHSPVNFVKNIRVPTLHAYGENDPRVDIDHWKRLKAQLDKYQKPYQFVREGNEGHGFHHENARIAFYREVEVFLAKNLRDVQPRTDVGTPRVIEMPARTHE